MQFHKLLVIFFVTAFLFSCKNKSDNTVFSLQNNCGIQFTNTVNNTKDFNIFSYRNFYNGGGCAIGDLNNDGLADVYFTANQGSNKLYLNKGNFKFNDITNNAGVADSTDWSTGVVMVDINHDGWLDIYVCNAGYINGKAPESKLYINNHNLTFTDKATEYGLTNTGGYATHAAFFDYDNDGDLDCFIINNSFIPTNTLNYENKRSLRAKDWPVKDFLKGGGDRFLRNDNGKYNDISEQAGIYGSLISFGLGVTVGDINNDGWLDVYVSNDFFERDYVYMNQKNGTFKDEYENCIQHSSHSSMGADMCDINNDGYADIFTTEMLPDKDFRVKTTSSFENIDVNRLKIKSGFGHQYMQNTLQVNNGNGKFLESAYYGGVAASDWSWGGLIFDADNNARPDIFVCNGIYKDVTDQDFIEFFADEVYQKMAMRGEKAELDKVLEKMPSNPIPNKMFYNKGGIQFEDKAKEWGLATPSFSNGAAYGDLDNDGDLDLIVNNVNQPAFIYQNNTVLSDSSHYIGIQLKDTGLNTFAIGSKIKLFVDHQIISRELIPTRGFQSSVDYKLIIGLGKSKKVDSMQIIWPNHTYQTIFNTPIDTVLKFTKGNNLPIYNYQEINITPFLDSIKNNFDAHKEDDYVDFYNERNIPEMLSHEGPKAAVGDVNKDGLEDVFICGAALQAGQLYLQNVNGSFTKKQVDVFTNNANIEEVASVFIDVDNDGDLDLFVGSGGNNLPIENIAYNNHLYINDGKGNFSESMNPIPVNNTNVSDIVTFDFNNDGAIDLFITGKSSPGNYGEPSQCTLLQNDGKGNFTDVTKTKYSILNKLGMVSACSVGSIFSKNKKDLVIVGEWMAPKFFTYNGKEFVSQKTSLDNLNGWWQSIATTDLDGDGDDDLILGNFGDNFYLKPTNGNPIKLWVNDFDANGTVDKIISKAIDGKDLPVHTRKDMSDQMPSLKKQNLKNVDYAKKSMDQLFANTILSKAKVNEVNYSKSCIAINNGNGNFEIIELPWQAQLTSINCILPTDINGDQKMDFLIGNNKYDFLPQFGRLDAGFGALIINNSNHQFSYILSKQSGISVVGCVRDIKPLMINNVQSYLWLRNNDFPVLFKKVK